MDMIHKLVLSPLQTLGTTEPVQLLGMYAATQFGSVVRIGTSFLVSSAYGGSIRVKVFGEVPTMEKDIIYASKLAKTPIFVTFVGLSGRISTSKKGEPIICGTAEAVRLVTPPPPSVRESLARLFEGSTGGAQ